MPISALRRATTAALTGVSLLALAGCSSSAFIPRSGPELTNLASQATDSVGEGTAALSYVLVNIGPDVVAKLPRGGEAGFSSLPRTTGRGLTYPRVGDTIAATLYESGAGGLFSRQADQTGGQPNSGGGNSVELPVQTVDANGQISFPYVGQVKVTERALSATQKVIEDSLQNKAIEPRVILTIRDHRASPVSVVGDVNTPGVFPVISDNKIIDQIARAGGIKSAAHETEVYLQRAGRRSRVSFTRLINSPQENINIQPGDVIFVAREPKSFVVVGATGQNAKVDFDKPIMTLADGLGRAAGLLDERADAGSVYVYRFEPRSTLLRLGADLSKFDGFETIPTLYNANLSSPQGFFLAKQFQLRSDDLIFVANASSVDLVKLFRVIQSATTPTRDVLTSRRLLMEPIQSKITSTTAIPIAN